MQVICETNRYTNNTHIFQKIFESNHLLGRNIYKFDYLRVTFMNKFLFPLWHTEDFHLKTKIYSKVTLGLPYSSVVKNLPANAETWVHPLIQEDATCCKAAKPGHHSYRAHTLEDRATPPEACIPQGPCSATREATPVRRSSTAPRK